jgi:hypothetical protein
MVSTLGSHRGGLISKTYPTPDDVQHDPKKIAGAWERAGQTGTLFMISQ